MKIQTSAIKINHQLPPWEPVMHSTYYTFLAALYVCSFTLKSTSSQNFKGFHRIPSPCHKLDNCHFFPSIRIYNQGENDESTLL